MKQAKDLNQISSGKEQDKNSKIFNERNARLYRALQILCRFSKPEDLFELQKKDFLKLCEVSQIYWNLKGPLFQNNSALINAGERGDHDTLDSFVLKASPFSEGKGDFSRKMHFSDYVPASHRFKRDLTCKGREYGQLIFVSSGKISGTQKSFLRRIGDMVSSALYFMEGTKQLETSKDQWDLVFDSFYRALCITDEKFQMLRTNKAFRQLTGRRKTEIAGKNVFSVFPIPVKPPSSLGKEETWVANSPLGASPMNLEFSIKTVFLTSERLKIHLLLVKDITEEIKMEREISNQAQSRELGLIKSSMAHELNNPIAGIKALLTVIENGLIDTKEKHFLGDMHSAVNRCQDIVSRLLSAASRKSVAENSR
ncbi:MAG: PAS domain S-box protein [Bdellovibrionales bacterium]|nr:PAS domain S-box protein [Bdellovibrionales bacterium]